MGSLVLKGMAHYSGTPENLRQGSSSPPKSGRMSIILYIKSISSEFMLYSSERKTKRINHNLEKHLTELFRNSQACGDAELW